MRRFDRILLFSAIPRHLCTLSAANLNIIINCYIQNGRLNDARQLFDQNTTSRDVVSWNSMIGGYVKYHQMPQAQNLFDKMPTRDSVSWTTILSGLRSNKHTEGAYKCFLQMVQSGVRPSDFTFTILISTFSKTDYDVLIIQLHAHIICFALNFSVFVGSALMRGYANLMNQTALTRVFDEVSPKDVSSWNALILGYMDMGLTDEAQRSSELMPQRNIVSFTTLIKGYISNNKLDKAWSIFSKMTYRNVITWTVMINGYVQKFDFIKAIKLLQLMLREGTQPNQFTFSSALNACSGCSSLITGQQVHLIILKSGVPVDVILSTSLVDMYAKCGDIETAVYIFESMLNKNLISWNAIIGGYAKHGLGMRAMEEFERMEKDGVKPDRVTFVNVLSACVHGGLVEEAEEHFNSMEAKYRIKAELEHYTCMVDLYGRAGQLEKAKRLIKGMPFKGDVVTWGALLSACGLHSSLELGELAAEGVSRLKKDHPVIYLVLSKIHGEKGVWEKAIELRKMMNEIGAKPQKGDSWLERCMQ